MVSMSFFVLGYLALLVVLGAPVALLVARELAKGPPPPMRGGGPAQAPVKKFMEDSSGREEAAAGGELPFDLDRSLTRWLLGTLPVARGLFWLGFLGSAAILAVIPVFFRAGAGGADPGILDATTTYLAMLAVPTAALSPLYALARAGGWATERSLRRRFLS